MVKSTHEAIAEAAVPENQIDLPSVVTIEWIQTKLKPCLDAGTRLGAAGVKDVLPAHVAAAIMERTETLLNVEATLVEVMWSGLPKLCNNR